MTSTHRRPSSPIPARTSLATLALLAAAAAPARAQTSHQILQGFDGAAGEDPSAFPRSERALWGRDSRLAAISHFTGTGGPGGNFDWVIRSGETLILDTTFAVITDATGTVTQSVVNGVVDVRHLVIEPNGVLRIRGPNPCRIAVSGDLWIEGRLLATGENHFGVALFNWGGPSLGAAGGPGGGRGGAGSPDATQSSPVGENGYGAFDVPDGGGGGGEAGYTGSPSVDARRGSGGGGGRFAADVRVPATGCPDQVRIGLDVEQGGPGSPLASGAIGGFGVRPAPGRPGPSPFQDGDPTNDFYGRMRTAGGATIVGELPRPWAGAGGGAGGDACQTATFPTTPYSPFSDEVGCGGGGGGGSLHIQVLGDATFVGTGRIDVSGGTGGGGENTNGINRVGGGSGGGSGGHLVLEVGGTADFQGVTTPPTGAGGLLALGGQGGEGQNGFGGANPGGVPTTPNQDSINLVAPFDPLCVPTGPSAVVDVVGSGGDGGPGLVQVHVADLSDIVPPSGPGVTLGAIVRPPPVGAADVNAPATWNRLVPGFGPKSSSRSEWTPVAGVGPVDVRFAGTDANGFVRTSGAGANARVLRLPQIAAGTLGPGPGAPSVDVDGRTLVVDRASIQDALLWAQDPSLLVGAEVGLSSNGVGARFEVESAILAGTSVRLTVAGPGTPLAGYGAGDTYDLFPRTFRVATDGTRDWLPISATIRILFQGAPANGSGGPDTSLASAWSADANALELVPGLAFARFQVDFDLAADGSELTTSSPRPSLEFLRVPYVR